MLHSYSRHELQPFYYMPGGRIVTPNLHAHKTQAEHEDIPVSLAPRRQPSGQQKAEGRIRGKGPEREAD